MFSYTSPGDEEISRSSDNPNPKDSFVEYDESSYPAAANAEESDCDEEDRLVNLSENQFSSSNTALGVPRHIRMHSQPLQSELQQGLLEVAKSQYVLSEDLSCAVCAEIFVEPCTLHCGHSFCQLCLAAIWKNNRSKSPLYLYCPVCRQPWVNFPGVNIQLRKIIENSHEKLVASRTSQFSESDATTIAQFKEAIEREKRSERHQTRQILNPGVWVVLLLAGLLICVLVIISAAAFFLMVMFSGGSEFIEKPVSQWNNEDVMLWLKGLGDWASHNISHVFSKEKITGAQLKLFNQSTLKSLGIHADQFRTQSLLLAIEQVQQKDYVPPRNFNEFKVAHRKKTILIGIMYKLWPRLTFFYVYLFEYHDVFLPIWHHSTAAHEITEQTGEIQPTSLQVFAFILEVLLVPHYVVGLFAWHWFNLHPWLCIAIMLHCVWATQSEAKKVIAYIFTMTPINWRLKLSQTVRIFFRSVKLFVLALTGGYIMWPIIPYFLCDGLFYLVVWNTVYVHLLVIPWKLLTARRRRINVHRVLLP